MDKTGENHSRCVNESQSLSDCNIGINCNSGENVMNGMTFNNNLLEFGSNYLNRNNIDKVSNDSNKDSICGNVIIYEAISDDSNNDDSYNYTENNSINNNYNNLDINEYEHKIKRLSTENQTLNDQLIHLEEQIIDLIKDKNNLKESLKSQKEYYKNKIDSYDSNIEELNQIINSLELNNTKLEEKLNQNNKEKVKLNLCLEETQDKLLYTEFELSEAQKNEADLRMSYKAAKDALNVEECDKYEAIQQLHELYMQCSSHENQIISLKEQVDSLQKQLTDKENELWFFRGEDRTSIGHDISVDMNTSSNDSSLSYNKSKQSKCTNSFQTCDSSKMNEHLYEKLSDFEDKEYTNCEGKIYVNDNENIKISNKAIKTDCTDKSTFFPSLPDVILRKLQLLRENCCSIETLTEQEIESKFMSLSLAFKTDRLTLEQRLHLQKHQRDVAEQDALNELQSFRESIKLLNEMMFSSDEMVVRSDIQDLLNKIETQVQVIGQTNAKISSRSELYGAVRQEERVSSAFDVILIHIQNLKRAKDKDEKELLETKRLLTSHHKKLECDSDSDNDHHLRRSVRSVSTTIIPKMNLIRVRRASVSSIEILPSIDTNRRASQSSNNVNLRHISSNSSNVCHRSRRRSMPASPALYRSRFGTDIEMSSQLEITTEEKGGSESDCASSVAYQESDDEQTSHNFSTNRKLSEDVVCNALNSSLIVSEPTINPSLKVVNNDLDSETETYSHSFSHENSFDNACDDDIENIDSQVHAIDFESRKTIANVIEYRQLANLFNSCFDGRLTTYLKGIVEELRFIFAIILLVLAMLIVIWSLLPTGLPCECHCYYSWEEIINRILMPYISKDKVSRTQ